MGLAGDAVPCCYGYRVNQTKNVFHCCCLLLHPCPPSSPSFLILFHVLSLPILLSLVSPMLCLHLLLSPPSNSHTPQQRSLSLPFPPLSTVLHPAVSKAACLQVESKQVVQVHAEAKPGQDVFHVCGRRGTVGLLLFLLLLLMLCGVFLFYN